MKQNSYACNTENRIVKYFFMDTERMDSVNKISLSQFKSPPTCYILEHLEYMYACSMREHLIKILTYIAGSKTSIGLTL